MQLGIYAVARQWDIQEGIFPGSEQLTDKFTFPVVMHSPEPFQSVKAALEWAYANDPETNPHAWVNC